MQYLKVSGLRIKCSCKPYEIFYFLCIGLIGINCGCAKSKQNSDKAPTHNDNPVESIDSTNAAKKYAIGTWTGESKINGYSHWSKYILKADGTGKYYSALAIDDGWGQSMSVKWHATTAKFIDTGKRWYGIELKRQLDTDPEDQVTFMGVFIGNDNMAINLPPSDETISYTRGDNLHFAK